MIMLMDTFFAASQLDNALGQSKSILQNITDTFLNTRSIVTFFAAFTAAIVLGRIIAAVMRAFARAVSRRADKAENLKDVNRFRRIETLTILTVAVVRMFLVLVALYVWWIYASPGQRPTALIGASALAVVITSATIGPLLRDIAYGGVMMAEHWFGVGDFIKVEPFADLEGVVERVTLRSIRIRGINGEIIWLNNQNIQGVRVSPKGVRTIAIDMFVSDLQRALRMVEEVNLRLPGGSLMVVRPLKVMANEQVADSLWHLTVIGETAPGREWLLEKYGLQLIQEMGSEGKPKLLVADPIARYADSDAERRFARTIQNARKSSLQRKRLQRAGAIANQITKPLSRTPSSKHKRPRKIQ